MENEEKQALERAGFKVGDYAEFLNLTEEEKASVESRLNSPPGFYIRALRIRYGQKDRIAWAILTEHENGSQVIGFGAKHFRTAFEGTIDEVSCLIQKEEFHVKARQGYDTFQILSEQDEVLHECYISRGF